MVLFVKFGKVFIFELLKILVIGFICPFLSDITKVKIKIYFRFTPSQKSASTVCKIIEND